jgi:enoyl-CoA hydratase
MTDSAASADSGSLVQYDREGPVAWVTLNRPAYRNAQTGALLYELDNRFAQAVDDDDVAVIVLGAAGEHFSAGHDIGSPDRDVDISYPRRATVQPDHMSRTGAERRWLREKETYLELCWRWRSIPKPTVASVQGACIAAGLMLAWSCDLIVASEDAFFSDPVLRMGAPGVELFAHPWMVGPRVAKEMLFTGGRLTAQRAFEVGMVTRVVPRADLRAETMKVATAIAEMPPFALTLAKQAVNQSEELMGLRAGVDAAFGLHQLAHASNAERHGDYIAGITPRAMRDAQR